MKTKFITVCDVIEDIISFRDYPSFSEPHAKKIISDFCRKIETDEQLIHKVALLEVDDHAVSLPIDQSIILQVAYKGHPERLKTKGQVTKWIQDTYDGSGCKYNITLDCPECHKEQCDHRGSYVTIDVDEIWQQQHPEYRYMHMDHMYRWGGMNKDNIPLHSPYNADFHLIKYAQHKFHNADRHIGGCLNLDTKLMSNVTTEYTIANGVLKINREGGQILIAYMAKQLDDEGYNMVPDIPEVIEGAIWYYEEMQSYKDYRRSQSVADYKAFQTAHAERIRLQGIINERLQTPSYTHWMSFLSNRWKRTIKDNNYFGNMNGNTPNYYENMMSRLTRK